MPRSYPYEAVLAVEPVIDELGAERPYGTDAENTLMEYYAGNYGNWQGTRRFIGYFGFETQENYDAYLANAEVVEAPSGAFGILNQHVDEPKTPAEWLAFFKGESE